MCVCNNTVITQILTTGETLVDVVFRVSAGIRETCLRGETVMFDSVVLQPGAGFTVWVLLVPITDSDHQHL